MSNDTYRRKYDTPTDAISQKKFDRENDKHVRRYVALKQRVEQIERVLKQYTLGR